MFHLITKKTIIDMAIRPATPRFEVGQQIKYITLMGVRKKVYVWDVTELDHEYQRYRLERTDEAGNKVRKWLEFIKQYPYKRVYLRKSGYYGTSPD